MSKYLDGDVEKFSEIFKALSNPNRLKIFLRLIDCCVPGTIHTVGTESEGCACVGELAEGLKIGAPTISHHIKELRRAGLIRMARNGQKMACWVDPHVIEELKTFFS